MAKKQEGQKSESIWLVLAIMLALGSLSLFYFLSEQSTLIKVAAMLVGLGVSFVVLLQGTHGKELMSFLRETRIELIKIVWPSRSETLKTTGIVFVAVIIVGLFLWLVDTLFLWLVETVLR